jgi:hypothetical protein
LLDVSPLRFAQGRPRFGVEAVHLLLQLFKLKVGKVHAVLNFPPVFFDEQVEVFVDNLFEQLCDGMVFFGFGFLFPL